MNRACVLALAAVLWGCRSEPRFDATTEATAKASIERLAAGLPEDQRKEFWRSVAVVSMVPAVTLR